MMEWWKTMDTFALLELVKRLEASQAPWYNIRAAVYEFVQSHQMTEITQSILRGLGL